MAIRKLFFALPIALSAIICAAEDDSVFDHTVKPLLNTYCIKCHSAEKHKGDLDLQQFSSLNDVKKHAKIWQSVAEQLATAEMPPVKETQPAAGEKETLQKWVASTLNNIALAHAGDPGPVVLRRLSNAEYTYTIRDLTGIDSLDPAKEFPVDGAAGEGFTNTGQALVMSPSLVTKYLDAGKEIANHAMLLPDGIRFSAKTTRRDRTEDLLTEIRTFYSQFAEGREGDKVVIQGIPLDLNSGGRLPIQKYIEATIADRDAIASAKNDLATVARERGLNAKYMQSLSDMLNDKTPSMLLDPIRAKWRAAKVADAKSIVADIEQWQKALFKFGSIGHIGKLNGPKAWMETVNPVAAKQDFKFKIPTAPAGKDITLYLVASDAGDGNEHDFAVWQEPKLVVPGRPAMLLKDVRAACQQQEERRKQLFGSAAKMLTAAAEAGASTAAFDIAALAQKHNVDAAALTAWLDFLGIGSKPLTIENHLKGQLTKASGFDFVNGWGIAETPNAMANSSDKTVRIPGNMKAHSVVIHPSPKLQAAVGWQSPVAATVSVEANITRAHFECGNGILWFLELRHGNSRHQLATGTINGNNSTKSGPFQKIIVQPGDLISILIDPLNGDHSCDLTGVDLTITASGDKPQTWNLAADVSPDILAGNPHADHFGNKDVWHFYTEPVGSEAQSGPGIPAGSLLARWQSAANADEKSKLADELQKLLTADTAPAAKDSPDAKLYKQLNSYAASFIAKMPAATAAAKTPAPSTMTGTWGVDPTLFGRHPNGEARDAASLCVHAPSVIEVHLPAELFSGAELVTTGTLDKDTGKEGSVQLQILTEKPAQNSGLLPSGAANTQANSTWTAGQPIMYAAPILVSDGSETRNRIETSFDAFRSYFPAALCYFKIVPVDEVVTLTLFFREDHELMRLMLDDAQKAKLERLWNEMHYISRDALTMVDAFEQIYQFSTQDGDPKIFEPMREPIKQRAADFKKMLVSTQPKHVDAVLEFAERAYRRPLTEAEKKELRDLYEKLTVQELPHDDSIRLLIARILISPAFLYRAERPVAGSVAGPITDWELANRLSYFLWSSMPDPELRALAASGTLHNPDVLAAQTKRMLADPRVRRMAIEFGCSWLHIHSFDELGEKSDRHFPTFLSLRGAMYEESIQFFTDFFQHDRPVPNILDSDYTFLNDALAKHYGIPGVEGAAWRRVDGVKKYSRGGVLAQASTLAKQSGASRTSPILRGNWVAEALLGDKLPRPPKDVPPLPDDVSNEKLSVRQLVEKHTSDARCASCHKRIDAFGFSLEAFDAIGRFREKDLGDHPIDTHAKTMDGAQFEGVAGLRNYLLTTRREAFMRQFCRKLLGYSLGRAVQLSDEPILKAMQTRLAENDFRISVAIDTIVQSSQFRNIRGHDAVNDE